MNICRPPRLVARTQVATKRFEVFEVVETFRTSERKIPANLSPRIRARAPIFNRQNFPLKAEDNVGVARIQFEGAQVFPGAGGAHEALGLEVVPSGAGLPPLAVALHDTEVVGRELHRLFGPVSAEKAGKFDLLGQ